MYDKMDEIDKRTVGDRRAEVECLRPLGLQRASFSFPETFRPLAISDDEWIPIQKRDAVMA